MSITQILLYSLIGIAAGIVSGMIGSSIGMRIGERIYEQTHKPDAPVERETADSSSVSRLHVCVAPDKCVYDNEELSETLDWQVRRLKPAPPSHPVAAFECPGDKH
mgnify:CR=1 FL=1|jgi:hypothetical protein